MKKGFTLIELAIVLVIIGLLAVSVLAGQDLIQQAKIHSTISQIKDTDTATNAFFLKYNGIPGDMKKANMFGLNKNQAGVVNTASSFDGAGNGNGDKLLHGFGQMLIPPSYMVSSTTYNGERTNFWIHLTNAQLIAGDYSVTNTGVPQQTPGLGYPKAKTGGGIMVISDDKSKNYYILGADSLIGINQTSQFRLSVFEAQEIDAKLDNGKSDNGMVINYNESGLVLPVTFDPDKTCATSGLYNTNYKDNINCTIIIRTSF